MAYVSNEAYDRLRLLIQPIRHWLEVKHLRRVIHVPELRETKARVDFLSLHRGKLLIGSKDSKKIFLYDPVSLDHLKTLSAPSKLTGALYAHTGNIICTPSSKDKVVVMCPKTGEIIKETQMHQPSLFSVSYDKIIYLASEGWIRHSVDGGMTWADYIRQPTDGDLSQMIKVHNEDADRFWVIDMNSHLREYRVTLPDSNLVTEINDKNIDRQVTWEDFKLIVPRNVWPQKPLKALLGANQHGAEKVDVRDVTLTYGGGGFVVVTHHFDKEYFENIYLFSVDSRKFIRLLLEGDSVENSIFKFALSVAIDINRNILCLGSYSGKVHIFMLEHWLDSVEEPTDETGDLI